MNRMEGNTAVNGEGNDAESINRANIIQKVSTLFSIMSYPACSLEESIFLSTLKLKRPMPFEQ